MFKEDSSKPSLPADVQKLCFNKDNNDNDHNDDDNNRIIILIIIINGKVMTKKSSKLSL